MKTLIISDIHNRHHVAEHIIKNEKPDLTIFLGDYFDSYEDTADDVRSTAQWFHYSVNQPNRIHLVGNHDLPYWFPDNKYLDCPGFHRFKWLLVKESVTNADWEKLKFYHNLDNHWLLSHAGAHPTWVIPGYKTGNRPITDIGSLEKLLAHETEKFLIAAGRQQDHWFVAWSRARSGTLNPGGLVWNDFHGDFHAILGVNQLVGHTHDDRPRWVYRRTGEHRQQWYGDTNLKCEYGPECSYNLCLDTGLQHYAVWNGSKLNIKTTADLIKKSLIGRSSP
jgi:hypothetical protein